MKRWVFTGLLSAALVGTNPAHAGAVVGQPAPEFSLTDTHGVARNLADFKGKFVVLEWNNPGCPFVVKHYRSGNMQSLQERYTKDGVVWLVINSTNPSNPDFHTAAALNDWMKSGNSAPTAYLVDSDGRTGRVYGAKTTPHMFVINPQGTIVYAGGIDDKRSTNPEDVKIARNFVVAALDESRAGRAVSMPAAAPYGCSVKYAE